MVFLFLMLTMFLPMHTQGFGGASVDVTLWGVSFEGGGESDSASWYDEEFDEEETDGLNELKASGPLMVVGLVASFLGTFFMILALHNHKMRQFAALALFGATVFAIIALILYNVGIDKLSDGEINDTFDTGAAFGLSIAAIVLGAIGGALGLVRRNFNEYLIPADA